MITEATPEEDAVIQYLAEHDLTALVIDASTDAYELKSLLDEDHKRAHLGEWGAALDDPDAPAGVHEMAQVQIDRWESTLG